MSSPSPVPSRSPRALANTIVWGSISAALYVLLYLFSSLLPELAAATRQGEKVWVLVPIGIALVFSFVHGAFTGHFWELLGLRAKR